MGDSRFRTREPQYGIVFDVEREHGRTRLGLMANQAYNQDPKRLLFTLSRYKFVAQMLRGRTRVLEVGCADAFGTRLVQQVVESVTATDFDEVFIEAVRADANPNWPLDAEVHDMLSGPFDGVFDGGFCLDVLEHIPQEHEELFLSNFVASLDSPATAIIGMPSIESQSYASAQSRAGHVNCKTGTDLVALLETFFDYVFLFSMNDEVVHTGFSPMAHYLLAVCCQPKGKDVRFGAQS